VRRKIVRKSKPSNTQDDKKLQGALKKLNVQPITGVEEVNMFREDGNVLHFSAPKGETFSLLCQVMRIAATSRL
jgi:nascent polypeptide-associated complex subunit beta